MKILVTGAAGFIGSHTIDYLVQYGHEIMAVDNFTTGKPENLKGFSENSMRAVDIRDSASMNEIFSQFSPHAVLHLAAQSAISTAWDNPIEDLNVNGMGTLGLIKLSIKYRVRKFVFSSTAAVYGKSPERLHEDAPCFPDTPYGISKFAAENYIRLLFPKHVILRYANIYGPRQNPIGDNQVIARAFRHCLHGDDFKVVGDGEQKRDFVYVADICFANYLALIKDATGAFNAASGNSHSVNEVLAELEKVYDVSGYKWKHTEKPDERGSVYMDGSLIERSLGWKARISLKQGIELTAKARDVQ